MKSTPDISEQIYWLKTAIDEADAIVVGAGAGMSAAAGLTYSGERFKKHFADFDKQRLFYTQGDYGLWQCSVPCHKQTYDNEDAVAQMLERQSDLRIPSELVPRCPKCGKPMSMNLRADRTFVQDDGWYLAAKRYEDFIRKHGKGKILYFELGVGGNTPGIIKYPFWQMVAANRDAIYACVNLGEAVCPRELEERAICVDADIGIVLSEL